MREQVQGINFNYPVAVIEAKKGIQGVQWRKSNYPVGHYFSPISGNSPSALGISPIGRTKETYELMHDSRILQSRAAPIIDTWTVPGTSYHTEGGGVQWYVTNPNLWIRK